MEDDDLEEELLAVAGRSQPGSKKRSRKPADSSDEDYGEAHSYILEPSGPKENDTIRATVWI